MSLKLCSSLIVAQSYKRNRDSPKKRSMIIIFGCMLFCMETIAEFHVTMFAFLCTQYTLYSIYHVIIYVYSVITSLFVEFITVLGHSMILITYYI